MASLRTLAVRFHGLLNVQPHCRLKACERFYSVFPKIYVDPVFDKKKQKELEETGEIKEITHLPIRPAFVPYTSSDFFDSQIDKFTKYLMRKGDKKTAREVLAKTFTNVKRIQIERYHKASPEEQSKIELDPKIVLHKAIENVTPVLELLKMKRGGITYQVPVPVTEKRSRFLAMNWLIQAGKDKDRSINIYERLAYELIDASNNTGRVVRKKQELYRQCEANRSYAHFRWI